MLARLIAAWQALRDPGRYDEAMQEVANLKWQNENLKTLVQPIRSTLPPDARGVIVSRNNGGGGVGIQDEYALADSWTIVPADGDAWLHLLDLSARQVTTYKPGQWTHVESGRLADITIKTEG